MKSNSGKILVTALVILNLLISAALVTYLIYSAQTQPPFGSSQTQAASRYTMYVGTNSAESNTPLFSAEEARKLVDAVCEKYVDGFTVFNADGNWVNAEGEKVEENTLVYCFYNATDDEIESILKEVLAQLHQSAILVEKASSDIIFYSGAE